ncbi:hypothetical protein N7G274_010131 [Stereocaulon virgatum]|uniref:Kelch repeat protein n=1 Tax=Stereocaulon virgatum TaxID=373712 RepID=A0ABR3ZVG5_9LECA
MLRTQLLLTFIVIVHFSVTGSWGISSDNVWTLEPRQATDVVPSPNNFLRRAYHGATVAGNWIYISGGEYSYRMDDGTINYTFCITPVSAVLSMLTFHIPATSLLSISLSQNWTNSTVNPVLTPNPGISGCSDLCAPTQWWYEDEQILFTGFGGWKSALATDPGQGPRICTFRPMQGGSGVWEALNDSRILEGVNKHSLSLNAFSPSSAFIVGGYGLPDAEMFQFDMALKTLTLLSAEGYEVNEGAVANGKMEYVPSFGPQGMFVAMGGGSDHPSFNGSMINFETVSVYDSLAHKWWNQTTTGRAPAGRIDFCTAGVSSTKDSYEIFVYGGWANTSGPPSVLFDTIHILTLPAFHWIQVNYTAKAPRLGLTCNAVGGGQILTIGGSDPNAPGIHNTDARYDNQKEVYYTPDPNFQGLAIFDMSTLLWASQYTAGLPGTYVQSDAIRAVYADPQLSRNPNIDPGVRSLLSVTHFAADKNSNSEASQSSTNTIPGATGISTSSGASQPSKHTNSRAIAGGVLGGLVVLALVLGLILIFIRRRRTARPVGSSDTHESSYTNDQDGSQISAPHQHRGAWNGDVIEMDAQLEPSELEGRERIELVADPSRCDSVNWIGTDKSA